MGLRDFRNHLHRTRRSDVFLFSLLLLSGVTPKKSTATGHAGRHPKQRVDELKLPGFAFITHVEQFVFVRRPIVINHHYLLFAMEISSPLSN